MVITIDETTMAITIAETTMVITIVVTTMVITIVETIGIEYLDSGPGSDVPATRHCQDLGIGVTGALRPLSLYS